MAGLKLLEELTALGPDRYDITMIGREPRPAYNRVLLSGMLAGDAAEGDIELRPRSWYAERGIELHTGVACSLLRPAEREVTLATGARIAFDRLVLRPGLRPCVCRSPAISCRACSPSATSMT